MDARGAIERLKRWLLPSSCGGYFLAALLLVLVGCAWAYSARDDLYETYLGLQPEAQNVGPAAYAAGERLGLEKTAGGARVTLNSIYAEEHYVVVGYEVEDLQNRRRIGGYPAELQPLLGSEKPTPREKEYLEKHGLGTNVVGLTDEDGTEFRMVNNSGQVSEWPDNMVKGPLQNMVAFEPDRRLEPGKKHRFRLEVPLYESPVVQMGQQKRPPPEPFEGGPFVFEFEVPVRPVPVVEVDQKVTAEGVTLTLERVMNSLGRPRAVFCYEPPDDERHWFLHGGKGTYLGGWGSSGSMRGVPPADCQTLLLNGPLEGRSSVEVATMEGMPDCRTENAETAQACHERIGERWIRGPWRFRFDVPSD